MSTREVTTITCDYCAAEQAAETFATETVVVKFNGDAPRQIDVCEEHAQTLTILRTILRSRGVTPDKSIPSGMVRCGICGQECRGGTGLAAHKRARHGSSS